MDGALAARYEFREACVECLLKGRVAGQRGLWI